MVTCARGRAFPGGSGWDHPHLGRTSRFGEDLPIRWGGPNRESQAGRGRSGPLEPALTAYQGPQPVIICALSLLRQSNPGRNQLLDPDGQTDGHPPSRGAHSPSKLGWPSRMMNSHIRYIGSSKYLFEVSFIIGWRVKCSHLACEISLTIPMVIHSPSLGVTSHKVTVNIKYYFARPPKEIVIVYCILYEIVIAFLLL